MTVAPVDGAAADKVIVQLEDPGAAIVPGEQVKDDGTTTIKLTVADCCWLLSVAVTVTFCAVLTVPVVAENVALL